MSTCVVCHRPLKSPSSVAAGVGPICAKSSNRGTSGISPKDIVRNDLPKRFVGCLHCGGKDHYFDNAMKVERCSNCNYVWKVDEFIQSEDDPHLYHANQSHDACMFCGHDDYFTDGHDVDRCDHCKKFWQPEQAWYEVRK